MPFVDDGSVLLGVPGAPGCTTAGFAGSACWARAEAKKEIAITLAITHVLGTNPCEESCLELRSRQKQMGLKRRMSRNTFIT